MSPPAWSMPHSIRKDCPFDMVVVVLESGQDIGVLEGVVAEDDAVVAELDAVSDEELWLPLALVVGGEEETLELVVNAVEDERLEELDAEAEVVDELVEELTILAPQTSL